MKQAADSGPTPVQLEGATRRFARRTALDAVTLRVERGQIVALVGPNGSGKTTLLKMVGGFLRPSAGSVRVFGVDPLRDPERVMRAARFAFAPPALYESLTAREHLHHLAALHDQHAAQASGCSDRPDEGNSPQTRIAAIESTLDLVGLLERADDRVRTYSFGMRQRLVLAQALLPRPRLLVLDEPADGLDPRAVLELRQILIRLRDEHGMTILMSSHLLAELEHLADRIVVMTEGRVVYCGAPDGLTAGLARVRITVDAPEHAAACLLAAGHEARVLETRDLEFQNGAPDLATTAALLKVEHIDLHAYYTHRPTLQEAFLQRLSAIKDEHATEVSVT